MDAHHDYFVVVGATFCGVEECLGGVVPLHKLAVEKKFLGMDVGIVRLLSIQCRIVARKASPG